MDVDRRAPPPRGGRRQPERYVEYEDEEEDYAPRRNPRRGRSPPPPSRSDRGGGGRSDRGGGRSDRGAEREVPASEFIKVSGKDEPKQYAGKVAWDARNGCPTPMLATGVHAINTAVKAVAIARQYLEEDDLELYCQPAFRDRSMGDSVAIYLSTKQRRHSRFSANEMTVSKNTEPTKTAGAIAARARETKGVLLTGIGPDAVTNALLAACHARMYLEADNLDVKLIPHFEQVEKTQDNGEAVSLNAMKMQVVIQRV